jgi:hypothetical protein
MGIPTVALKCPYCHHWQRWLTWHNPILMPLLLAVPINVLYGVAMEALIHRPFKEWEPFAGHANEVRIFDTKMAFGEDACEPTVVIVGRVENRSPVNWKDVRFQVDIKNPRGEFVDTSQFEGITWRLPAGDTVGFKVSFRRLLPEKEYAEHTVRIISATDTRRWL